MKLLKRFLPLAAFTFFWITEAFAIRYAAYSANLGNDNFVNINKGTNRIILTINPLETCGIRIVSKSISETLYELKKHIVVRGYSPSALDFFILTSEHHKSSTFHLPDHGIISVDIITKSGETFAEVMAKILPVVKKPMLKILPEVAKPEMIIVSKPCDQSGATQLLTNEGVQK